MGVEIADGAALMARALVVGGFGGLGLLLAHRFSRRGAIMYPVYAAILFVATLVISQFSGVTFGIRFLGVMLSLVVATIMAMGSVLYRAELRRRARAAKGLPPIEGHAPWWSAPFVFASVAAVSAGAAALIR